MKKRLEDMISYVFGKYDMRTGIDNKIRMEKLLQFCWENEIITFHSS